jgi:hypothetical protein
MSDKVKIKKIPMKILSPKELKELQFDKGISAGGSGSANMTKGAGYKRGAYGRGVGAAKGKFISSKAVMKARGGTFKGTF